MLCCFCFLLALFFLLFAFLFMRIVVEISSEATQQRGQNKKKSSHGQVKKTAKCIASLTRGKRSAVILTADKMSALPTDN